MAFMLDAVLKANAVEYFQRSHTQPIRLACKHFGRLFVDNPGSYTTTGHPVGCHQAGGPGADD